MGTFSAKKSANFVKIVCTFVLCFHVTSAKREAIFPQNAIGEGDKVLSQSERDAKLFPFLALVNVAQSPCTTTLGTGSCLKKSVCTSMMGQDLGTCAQGFGTCCAITKKCAADPIVVTTNLAKLIPGDQFNNLCRYEIPKQTGICQIRLDFTRFEIAEGDRTEFLGECNADTLTISGHSNGGVADLCGNLDGQHMYLEYGSSDKIYLDLYMVMEVGQTWDITVTMIKCDSEDRAPPGCFQYFTNTRDMVTSFNFKNRHQLNNQDYSVCIKTNPAMKKITWTSCGDMDFAISDDPTVNGPGVGAASGDLCKTDWVMFYGINKYCGTFLDTTTPIETRTQPFMMNVHFDSRELIIPPPPVCGPNECDYNNPGFCLMYATTPN